MFFMRSFAEYLINETARVPRKSGRKTNVGKEVFVHIKSKKLPNFSRSEIFKKFILKSPMIAEYIFSH